MVRHLRGLFERAAILKVSGDARRAKGMIADPRLDASGLGAPCRIGKVRTVITFLIWHNGRMGFDDLIRGGAIESAFSSRRHESN